jgi:hypothetical protein
MNSIGIQCSNRAGSSIHWPLRKGMFRSGMGGGGEVGECLLGTHPHPRSMWPL